ncbi:MAG: hypothetical protein R3246_14055, partial [Acidimicrobiia bacterium]|nr:hypothetical protein [Acidimicrobiia bacterium]
MALAAAILALAGPLVEVVAIAGRAPWLDVVIEDFVPQLAAFGVGFGVLSWFALPRESGNRVVWVFLVVAVSAAAYCLTVAAIYWGLRMLDLPIEPGVVDTLRPEELPVPVALLLVVRVITVLPAIFGLMTVAVLLFPDGTLPSRRWRWVLWVSIASMVVWAGAFAVIQYPGSSRSLDDLQLDLWVNIPLAALVGASVASFAGLWIRFRRSVGVVRQQIRW